MRFATHSPSALSRQLAQSVGEKPEVDTVTLAASATSTTFSNPALRPTSHISLTPLSANAAGALSGLYLATPSVGQVVIHHASSSATDKMFSVGIFNR